VEGQVLRLFIQQKLADDRLPKGRMMRLWRGPGNGTRCNACGEVLAWDESMVEGFTATAVVMRFHTGCFDLWDDERHAPS
jgi:hypothetical protein